MESFLRRLDKLEQTVIGYRISRENTATCQKYASYIFTIIEIIGVLSCVIISLLESDFTGKLITQILTGIVGGISAILLSFLHFREHSFNNGIAALGLRRLERRIERLRIISSDNSYKLESLDSEYDRLCDEYDRIELSNNTDSQYYQISDRSNLAPTTIMIPPPPPYFNYGPPPPPHQPNKEPIGIITENISHT